MANIDLTGIYRKRNEKISPVDTNIILNKSETDTEIYSDFKIDLEFSNIRERQLNAKENNKDLTKITNEESVINALRNILHTTRNTRILDPSIEFDLRNYLFDGLNTTNAWFIGYEICTKIGLYEPRVTVNNVNITVDYDNDCYIIDLSVMIPSLSKIVNLPSILDKDGMRF